MHKCTRATITVHICTVIVALLYIILIISNFAHFFPLSSPFAKPTPLLSASSSDTHTPTYTKSKINQKNKKLTTKSTTDTIKPNTPTHGYTNRDRESGSALVANWPLWQIDTCGGSTLVDWWVSVLGSKFFSPCLDWSFKEKSFSPCLDQSFRWNRESHEWRDRVWDKIIKKVRKMII